ncbi:MAG TPA: DmsE family decaheme c-type cytochrome [Vicinamibacterales bacterium]|nr:DmsE family decaheme c-type cytochrome [Vicinamibacterales bacterium]
MLSFVQTRGRAAALAVFAVVWLALGGLAMAGQGGQATPTQDPQGYAGEQTCLTCHEAQTKGYHGSAHAQAFIARAPINRQGCESCHGPGAAHVEAGGDPTKIASYKRMTADEASATCTSCHNRSEHALWAGSQHERRDVGCVNCHSVHAAKSQSSQLRATTQTALCATCHRDKTKKQNRFNHMPVREGKMECSSCHNVHGSGNVKLLNTGTTENESCMSCHQEKRGPMLWEHPPVAESCTTCHDAHGTNNDRMLTAKQPFLCQRCHVTARHPPTVYEGTILTSNQNANKMFSRACLNCHTMIHGSNAPGGRAFLR